MEEEEEPQAQSQAKAYLAASAATAAGEIESHWWWAAGSAAQLGWGIASVRKGYTGSSTPTMMPLKAAFVASLFVAAAASAAVSALHASGIHNVEDMMEVGKNVRTALGAPPRARDE